MRIPFSRRPHFFAYDSPSDRRRANALAAARSFSLDPQYSFHELPLSNGEAHELWACVARLATKEDRLLLVTLDPRQRVVRLGKPAALTSSDNWGYLG